jgi:DNA gyrase subunit B
MVDDYSSGHLKVLTLPEAVRKRPGMYFGNINSLAVNSAIYEAVSNAVDQYLSGKATKVKVEVNGAIVRVIDDGPGLPFDKPSPDSEFSNLAELYFVRRHNSPTADNHAPHVHIIGGGLGMAVVNAASDWVKVRSSNCVNVYSQIFGKGGVISPCTIENIKCDSGTELEIKLDDDLFQGYKPDLSHMRKTLFELSHFYPGLVVEFQQERFLAPLGLLDLAYIQYSYPPLAWTKDPPVKYFFEQLKDGIQIQVATLGEADNATRYKSWVNGVETVDGGTHISGLIKAFKNTGWSPGVAFIHVIMHDPRFAGPSRDALRSSQVEIVVEELVTKSLKEFQSSFT